MKKLIFLSALCALALTGCKDDSEPTMPDVQDADYTGLALNEVCGGETDSKDDWIELYNTSDKTINLEGVKLTKTDEEGVTVTLYTFAKGDEINGKSFTVRAKENLAASISNSKSVTISLLAPSDKVIDSFAKDTELGAGSSHEIGGSYARIPDGTGAWKVVAKATKGAANDATEPVKPEIPADKDYTGLVLNELNGNAPKYIEIYNNSDAEMDITGVQIKKDDEKIVYVAPEGTKVGAHSFLVLLSDQTDYSTGFTSGFSATKSAKIELLSPSGEVSLDVFKNLKADGTEVWGDKKAKYNAEEGEMAFSRKTDGTGEWYLMKATQGKSNSTSTETGVKIEW